MPAYVSRPRTVLGAHKVTTDEIADDIRANHQGHPRLNASVRAVQGCGVRSRYFTRPLSSATVSGTDGIEERALGAFADALDLAEQAAKAALGEAGLAATDIDAVVTTHSTSWAVPNLDVLLVSRLGMRPTVRSVPQMSLACTGGAKSLIRATDLVAARPGDKVLVVAAEVLSAIYHHDDDGMEAMIYKALFGDSAGAAVVSGEPLGPGLAVEDSFEHVLPDAARDLSGRITSAGLHFDATRRGRTAFREVLPTLTDWLGARRTDFPVLHPGSAPIITETATALGLDADSAHHSLDTLTHEGNLGGVSVLRVLERTHDAPPAAGDRGTMVAYGPGFTTAALHGHWHA
ncbi:beta-ketoacyl-[acyl-carrier-protein] synthase family protein [Streptomyces beihaiensis]|uniref:PhlD n=1 Tax=Streptomyces beihaiensis TaxID=2984495 RepID=A0ABT3TVY5_9ACTN|nr:PhlD [Streptomyces beihaiensis]MCX3061191.1 PhlD [Streptomyces beihaiensis]